MDSFGGCYMLHVVITFGDVVDYAVLCLSFFLQKVAVLCQFWISDEVDDMDRLHFIVRAAKQFSLLKLHATCLHYSNLYNTPVVAN